MSEIIINSDEDVLEEHCRRTGWDPLHRQLVSCDVEFVHAGHHAVSDGRVCVLHHHALHLLIGVLDDIVSLQLKTRYTKARTRTHTEREKLATHTHLGNQQHIYIYIYIYIRHY